MQGLLGNVRVLDFGRYIAGPYCAALLGDFGADVIRVERLEGGEDRYVMPISQGGEGALYLQMNRNKRSLALDPTRPEGREIIRKLVATADVVVANLPAAGLAALGIDYASLKAIKPDIILTTVNAFGNGGPASDRLGFDGVGQCLSGAAYFTGFPDQPIKAAVPYVDFATAAFSSFGTMGALLHRERTGTGQHVEASLLHSAVVLANSLLIEEAVTARARVPSANRSQISGPSDIFRTRDGWIVVQVVGGPMFRRWAKMIGEEHWPSDPRFVSDEMRGDNGAVLSERMARWTAELTTAEALGILQAHRIPASRVNSIREALEDEQVEAVGILQELPHPELAMPAPIARTPVSLSETPGEIRERAPFLGEHTGEILGDLGYTADCQARLREIGVVRAR